MITRAQALAAGLTDAGIRARLRARRWQRIHRQVYAAFTGPLPRASELWTAVLCAGPGAALSHQTAAELAGLAEPSNPIHVTIPGNRRFRPPPGIHVHHSARDARQPNRQPPRTRIEETVVDLTQSAPGLDQAIGWLTRACARRLTTAQRLVDALSARRKLRWRKELTTALADVAAGCHSPLELRYLKRVERAHRLPAAIRQHRVRAVGATRYEDVRYHEFGTVVELDGLESHPADARWRDRRRDNAVAFGGAHVLRYGFADVFSTPCRVAEEVGALLQARGWPGEVRTCGPHCMIR